MSHLDLERQELTTAPFLFSELPETVRSAVEEKEAAGEWTGERLWQRNRELYMGIVRMLGVDMPVQSIAKLLAVSDNTVRAVRERETTAIADFRTKQGVRRRKILNMALDRIEQELPTADLKDAVIAYGILDDKERLDSGAPTQRIEITHAPATQVYEEFLKEIIDVQAQAVPVTGFGGREDVQTREGDAVAATPAVLGAGPLPLAEGSGAADMTSADAMKDDGDATACDTDGRVG